MTQGRERNSKLAVSLREWAERLIEAVDAGAAGSLQARYVAKIQLLSDAADALEER